MPVFRARQGSVGVTPTERGPDTAPVPSPHGRVTRYRLELPRAGLVETHRGYYEATEFAEDRTGWKGRYLAVRDRVIGTTLSSQRLETERLSKIKALAVFSSDAISSVAYAPQEILFVLVLAGSGAIKWSAPIAIAITLLLAIVVASYRQTVRAYPNGGGSYIVAHENLGIAAGLIAAASLLTDYVLTVSVSIASGIDALASLNGEFRTIAVPLAVAIVIFVALINLRGVSESGTFFSFPTYAFIFLLSGAIVVALIKVVMNGASPFSAGAPRENIAATQGITLFLLLRAFASGCSAMTGVEAISNGVQAFKKPASKNASQTLIAMGLVLGFLFMGSSLLARHYGFVPHEDNTILSQLGREAYGDGSVLFALLNVMTAGILILAANTSFADFPRLSAILARDGYMPRIFHSRGNRLVFSYGIIALAALASGLLIGFNAETTRLIPLYALGVFLSFTLSQAGMVRHWLKSKEQGWRRSIAINGLGAVTTAVVFVVILEAKFAEGAWVVCILIPVLAGFALLIGRFYKGLERALRVAPEAVLEFEPAGESRIPVVVPVDDINLATVMALGSACQAHRDVTALHVVVDPDEPSTVPERWKQQFPGVPLVVIESPYRSVAEPIAAYLNDRVRTAPHEVAVLVPILEVPHWFQRPLVNQSLKRLNGLVAKRRRVSVEQYRFAVDTSGPKRFS
ncbi:MAG: APC family permease [Dehalococcoidia bacterium]|nr:APC family permease [Dehalococcoidia bacterium]